MIYYFTPYSASGRLAKAYNECCEIVPKDEDWIGLLDCDILLFSDFGQQVEYVLQNSNFDLYTCYATRIGCPVQRYQNLIDPESDLLKLKEKVDRCATESWGQVTELFRPISGYFLMFQKKLWKEFPFQIHQFLLGVDMKWTQKLLQSGKRIGRMDGLCAIHYYRLATNNQDHLHPQIRYL